MKYTRNLLNSMLKRDLTPMVLKLQARIEALEWILQHERPYLNARRCRELLAQLRGQQ